MTYKRLLESVCGKKRASFYVKGLGKAKKSLMEDEGKGPDKDKEKDFSEKEMLMILERIKDDSVYNVQNLSSIGAMSVAFIALIISLGVSLIQSFLTDAPAFLLQMCLSILALGGLVHVVYSLLNLIKYNNINHRVTHMQNAILLKDEKI